MTAEPAADAMIGRTLADRYRIDALVARGLSGALALEDGEPLVLRVFVDHSVLEVFANSRLCLTSRVYPSTTSLGVALFAQGGSVHVPALDVWNMRSIWKD